MTGYAGVCLAVTGVGRGGLWRHVRDLGEGLQELGVPVRLELPHGAVELAGEATQRGWAVNGAAFEREAFHLHLGNTFDRRAVPALVKARVGGHHVVVTEHLPRTNASDPTVAGRPPRPGATLAKSLLKGAQLRLSHRVIAVSTGSRDFLTQRFATKPNQVVTIFNGIDVGRAPLHPRRSSIEPWPRFGAVGSVIEQKGFDLLVRSAEMATRDWRVEVWGEGPHRGELIARARRTVLADGRPRVVFHGWCDDVPQELRLLDGLVIPSRWEACPYSVLEAMAEALPVLGTRIDGVTDLVVPGVTGELCEPSAEELTNLIDGFCDRASSWRAMGEAGRARILKSFRLDQMVQATADVYASLLPDLQVAS